MKSRANEKPTYREVFSINPLHLVGMGLFLVLSYLALVFFVRKNRRRGLIILSVFWLVFIGAVAAYFFDARVKNYVDTFLSPVEAHQVLGLGELPLPPKTALSFRTGEESARYFCRQSLDEIIGYYHSLPGADVLFTETGQVLFLVYRDIPYTLTVLASGKHGTCFSIAGGS